MNIAPATAALFATPGAGSALALPEDQVAAFSTLLAVSPPTGSLPQAVPSLEGTAIPLTSTVSNAQPPQPVRLAAEPREPIGALRPTATLADARWQAPASRAAMVTLPAPDPIQPSVPELTVTVDLEAASTPGDAERLTGSVLSNIVAAKNLPRLALPSPPATAAIPRSDRLRPVPDAAVAEAGTPVTAADLVVALPVAVLPEMPPPVVISASDRPPSAAPPAIDPALAGALPTSVPRAGAAPIRSDLLTFRRPGVALLASGPVQSLSSDSRPAAMPDSLVFDGSRTATPAPASATETIPRVALPPDPAMSAVPPWPHTSNDVAFAAIETPRLSVMLPVAGASNGHDKAAVAATLPLSQTSAAITVDRRGRPLLRDRTDAPASLAFSPGEMALALVLARDGMPIAPASRDAASPIKTMTEPPTETAVVTNRLGNVQIAVEGTATDVKVSLALTPTAVLAPADAQRLASGLAADLAATGVRLQSLDISGGDPGRGGTPQGQRDSAPQRPPPAALPPQRSPAMPRSDRYA